MLSIVSNLTSAWAGLQAHISPSVRDGFLMTVHPHLYGRNYTSQVFYDEGGRSPDHSLGLLRSRQAPVVLYVVWFTQTADVR